MQPSPRWTPGTWDSFTSFIRSFIHPFSHSVTVSTRSFGRIRSLLEISAHRDPLADLLPRRLPTGRFQAREVPLKQICCPGGFPRTHLLPRSLPTSRFDAQEPPQKQIVARKAPTSSFGRNIGEGGGLFAYTVIANNFMGK